MRDTVWQMRINSELKAKFFEQAEKENRTASNLLETIIKNYLKEKGEKKNNMKRYEIEITNKKSDFRAPAEVFENERDARARYDTIVNDFKHNYSFNKNKLVTLSEITNDVDAEDCDYDVYKELASFDLDNE